MKKVSILWFSKAENTYKVFSLKKFQTYALITLHFFIYTALIFLICFSIYQNIGLRRTLHKINVLNSQLNQMNATLREKNLKIASLQKQISNKDKKIANIQDKLNITQTQLNQIKKMEVKIRKFLGLEDESIPSGKFSHQGGFEFKKSNNNTTNMDPSELSLFLNNDKSPNDLINYSKDLEESFSQLVDYLKKRQNKIRHMPSILPVEGKEFWISCGFGWRINPFTQQREFHAAIDIAGAWKTPIVAPADGVVIKVAKSKLLGNYIKIRHTRHITTLYGHLYKPLVKKGEKVKRWQVIGLMGNTGHSTGTHVHYKVEVDGKAVNPLNYIYDQRLKKLALR